MAEWFLQKGAQRIGPVSLEVLRSMTQAGQVLPTDLVWTGGMAAWQAASTVSELADVLPAGALAAQPMMASSPYATAQPIGYAAEPTQAIPNLLPWAIAATILCCVPGGIVSIIYAAKANSAKEQGRFAEAQVAAGTAKTWLIVSAVVGVVFSVIWFAMAVAGASSR